MVELGQIALILSFMMAGYSTIVGFAGGMLNGRDLAASARWGFYSIAPLLLLATATLIYAFVTNDFSATYLTEKSFVTKA
jgi:cytochrome c biogenesis factor